jgi:hypothetical protein
MGSCIVTADTGVSSSHPELKLSFFPGSLSGEEHVLFGKREGIF